MMKPLGAPWERRLQAAVGYPITQNMICDQMMAAPSGKRLGCTSLWELSLVLRQPKACAPRLSLEPSGCQALSGQRDNAAERRHCPRPDRRGNPVPNQHQLRFCCSRPASKAQQNILAPASLKLNLSDHVCQCCTRWQAARMLGENARLFRIQTVLWCHHYVSRLKVVW